MNYLPSHVNPVINFHGNKHNFNKFAIDKVVAEVREVDGSYLDCANKLNELGFTRRCGGSFFATHITTIAKRLELTGHRKQKYNRGNYGL